MKRKKTPPASIITSSLYSLSFTYFIKKNISFNFLTHIHKYEYETQSAMSNAVILLTYFEAFVLVCASYYMKGMLFSLSYLVLYA